MTTVHGLLLRDLKADDFTGWKNLWTGYLNFYDVTLSEKMYDLAFARFLSDDPGEMSALLAVKSNTAVGLAHTLTHRSGPMQNKIVYLQDLFVSPDARGTGVGRALIAEIYRRADAAGTPHVYWTTAPDNRVARRLYDSVATDTGFIKYKRAPKD